MRSFLFMLTVSIGGAIAAAFMVPPTTAKTVGSTELVMMEEYGCPWCERWKEEIGVFYHKTSEGRVAPLRLVDIHEPIPDDLKFLKPAYFTPTFILVSGGQEVGRIKGYPGEDFFWPMLAELVSKIQNTSSVEAQATR